MKAKRKIALAIFGLAVGSVLVVTQAAWTDKSHQSFKLEGSWSQVYQPPFNNTCLYTCVPSDPSGREAALSGTVLITDITFGGAFPDAQYASSITGQAAVTGPDKAVFTALVYGMKQVGPLAEKVFIILDSGTIRVLAPGKLEVTHNQAVYLPLQDMDGDGLPDKGQAPIACIPGVVSIDTRVPLLPPCKP